MSARVTQAPHFAHGVEYDVYALRAGPAVAEVWPNGFNLTRWAVGGREIVYCPPAEEFVTRPTRGGIPVLFPFPNRIRAGRFPSAAGVIALPLNDSTKQNAIHGFTPRAPWHAPEYGAQGETAWLRSTFDSAVVDDGRANWPAAYRLTVTIHLTPEALRYEALVENTGATPLPFGLGYHPYFRTTATSQLTTGARARWVLADSLPTGEVRPLDAAYDLRSPRPVADLTLDDVYTDLPPGPAAREVARLIDPDGVLSVRADAAFGDLVVFTPPHRRAVAIEPYTCPTDAANLSAEGVDCGWQELAPGDAWTANVEYRWAAEQMAGVTAQLEEAA